MDIDILRARITHPSGIVSPGRFIFRSNNGSNIGTAVVWQDDRRRRSASRVLYTIVGRYEPGKTSRHQSVLYLGEGQEQWTINPLSGGCSCRNRTSLTAGYSTDDLLTLESITP